MSNGLEPRYEQSHLGKEIALSDPERSLLITEYQPLRDEVNRSIDRMNQNEAVCAAFAFTLIFASQSIPSETALPAWLLQIASAILALLTAYYGEQRNSVFRRHLSMVEKYLGDLERRFSSNFGWTNFYSTVVEGTMMQRQSGTRNIFWHILKFTTFANVVFVAFVAWTGAE